jgi:hypothetical protein
MTQIADYEKYSFQQLIDEITALNDGYKLLKNDRDVWRNSAYYLGSLASPYVAPNAPPEDLVLDAYTKHMDAE